jgi:transcriptional regulator with XRE-family HTH domain
MYWQYRRGVRCAKRAELSQKYMLFAIDRTGCTHSGLHATALLVSCARKSMQWTEGDVIRKLRTCIGHWTLAEYSKKCGVNIQVISNIETGTTREPRRATLTRLGAPFGLTWTQILALVPPASVLPRPQTTTTTKTTTTTRARRTRAKRKRTT